MYCTANRMYDTFCVHSTCVCVNAYTSCARGPYGVCSTFNRCVVFCVLCVVCALWWMCVWSVESRDLSEIIWKNLEMALVALLDFFAFSSPVIRGKPFFTFFTPLLSDINVIFWGKFRRTSTKLGLITHICGPRGEIMFPRLHCRILLITWYLWLRMKLFELMLSML